MEEQKFGLIGGSFQGNNPFASLISSVVDEPAVEVKRNQDELSKKAREE